jgi:phage gpG-like protein
MAPVKTGRLRETITAHKTGPLTAVIGPQVPYGAYQEFGTATRGEFGGSVYEIRPKRPGGWLRFEVDGKVVFAKVVHHPGIAPRPYMRPALERIITPFGQSLAELGGTFIVYGPHQPETRDVSAT